MFVGCAFGQSPFSALPFPIRFGHRPISAEFEAASQAERYRPFLMARIETAGDPLTVWSGLGDLVFEGETYLGVGGLYGISDVEETTELAARGIKFSLSGVPLDMLSTALGQMRQGVPAELRLGLFMLTERTVIGTPTILFRGLTDVPEIDENPDSPVVSISAENRLIDLDRPRVRRYTTEDQKLTDATDKGFDYVPALQDTQVLFGKV